MQRVQFYSVSSYTYRKITPQGILDFGEWIASKSWQEIENATSPSAQVRILHEGMEKCFEMKKRSKKSTEPVWMTDEIRLLIKKNPAVYIGGQKEKENELK